MMGLLSIKAKIVCDDCGKPFEAAIDPAATCETGFDAVTEALTGGEGSYEDGEMRCLDCTRIRDRKWIAENPKAISGIRPTTLGWYLTAYDGTQISVPRGHAAGEPKFDASIEPYLNPCAPGIGGWLPPHIGKVIRAALTDTPPPGVEDQEGSSSQIKPQPPRAAPTSGAVTNSNADLKG